MLKKDCNNIIITRFSNLKMTEKQLSKKKIKNFTTFTGYCLLLEAATIKIQHEFSLVNIHPKLPFQ